MRKRRPILPEMSQAANTTCTDRPRQKQAAWRSLAARSPSWKRLQPEPRGRSFKTGLKVCGLSNLFKNESDSLQTENLSRQSIPWGSRSDRYSLYGLTEDWESRSSLNPLTLKDRQEDTAKNWCFNNFAARRQKQGQYRLYLLSRQVRNMRDHLTRWC